MTKGPCIFETLGNCDGRITWHHVVPQQRIKSVYPEGVIVIGTTIGILDRKQLVTFDDEIPAGVPLAVRRVSLPKLLKDERNREWLCAFHHGQVEMKRLRCPVSESVRAFAVDLGLEWSLDSDALRATG